MEAVGHRESRGFRLSWDFGILSVSIVARNADASNRNKYEKNMMDIDEDKAHRLLFLLSHSPTLTRVVRNQLRRLRRDDARLRRS